MKSSKLTLLFVGLALVCFLNAGWASDSMEDSTADSPPAATDKAAPQGYLGLGVSSLPTMLAAHLQGVIGKERGVLVSEVTEGSPAAKAGLRKHDVLVRYGDQDLYSPEQLVKRVRNDDAGNQVELEFARAGKMMTATVTLGGKKGQAPVLGDWPGFAGSMNVPLGANRSPFLAPDAGSFPFGRDFSTEDQDASEGGTEWTFFEKMSISKDVDGTYTARITFRGNDENSISREYTGTREEVRSAIETDTELPASQRQQLLRSLDDRGGASEMTRPRFPRFPLWERELFNWPDVRF